LGFYTVKKSILQPFRNEQPTQVSV